MKPIILDFSSAGLKQSALHFLKGIVLYALVGAIGYATSRLGSIHATTPEAIASVTLVSEALQALSKWVTTQKASVDQVDMGAGQGIV